MLRWHLSEEPAAALWCDLWLLSLCEDRGRLLRNAHCGALGGRWCALWHPAKPRRLLLTTRYKARINLSPGLIVLKENVVSLGVIPGPDRLP